MKTPSARAVSLVATLFVTSLLAAAEPGVPLVFPDGVGVNIHFTRGHERDLDLIRDGGFKFIRMDFGWGGIERKKGEYDWSAYDELTANLEKRGLRAIYILDYSNGLYEETVRSINPLSGKEQRDIASPRKPESIAAFARWAGAAASHFKGGKIIWEIWNEPNISFWKPKPNVKDYTALVLETCKAVRAADPGATIIAPATSEFPWAFLEELFAAGVLAHLDAVSVHPYRSYTRGPETAAPEFLRLRGLIERYAPEGKKGLPIISGEWGYATHDKGVSLETQAAFIARQQIANVLSGVPISIWYDWKNDGTNPAYNEDNFGTVSNNLAAKPAYLAVKTLSRELGGFRIARRLKSQEDEFILLLIDANGKHKLAAWTTGKPRSAEVAVSRGDAVTAVNGQGKTINAPISDGRLRLSLDIAPQYVTFVKPSPAMQAAAAWTIDGFVPTLVAAGGTPGPGASAATIPIKVSNPFDHPVSVHLVGTSRMPISQGVRRTLKPGETFAHHFTASPRVRTAAPVDYTISAAFVRTGGSGEVISRSSEQRSVIIANPLELTLAPAGKSLRVIIDNPSGAAFTGAMLLNETKTPVSIQSGGRQTTVETTAPDSGRAALHLVDEHGNSATDPIEVRFAPLNAGALTTALDGDAKVGGTASVTDAAVPRNSPVQPTYRVDYSFEAGWKFARVHSKPVAIAGSPKALGLWIHGDSSGNALRMRVTDGSGQTFQPNGPNLDWTGWRWVEFDLRDMSHAGHWGGANDGVVHGALQLDTLLLIDGARKKSAGAIYFGGPTLVY